MQATYSSSNGATYTIKPASCPPRLYRKRLNSGVYSEQEDGLYKRCSKCRDYWPADSEFFYPQRSDDGLNPWCKACYREWHETKKNPQNIVYRREKTWHITPNIF